MEQNREDGIGNMVKKQGQIEERGINQCTIPTRC